MDITVEERNSKMSSGEKGRSGFLRRKLRRWAWPEDVERVRIRRKSANHELPGFRPRPVEMWQPIIGGQALLSVYAGYFPGMLWNIYGP